MQDYDWQRIAPEVAKQLLGEPSIVKTNEWRWGNKGSMVFTVDTGQFYDFEEGVGFGVAGLIKHLGKNVEDRHAAPIFDSAAKMIAAALQAKQAKMDKKMKMIELQMRQARLEKDSQKIDAYVAGKKHEIGEEEDIEGRIVGNRSAMLAEIMKNLDEKDK